jgi:hypothetical protein
MLKGKKKYVSFQKKQSTLQFPHLYYFNVNIRNKQIRLAKSKKYKGASKLKKIAIGLFDIARIPRSLGKYK